MKRLAILLFVCALAAAGAIGSQAWQWRERKLRDDARNQERSAAENAAAGRLGLKTLPLPPHPLDRRAALEDVLRLGPDRRFLLAARELAGVEVTARFAEGRWILSAGKREFGRVAELPDFPELMNALAPLAKAWVDSAKVTGKAQRVRAVRGHKEAFAAVRDAQTRWSRGDRGAAVLHDAASAVADLMLLLPRAFDADDRLDAHAVALCAADAAAGADVRSQQAVLALAFGYAGAARALAAQDEPALHAFVSLDRRKLAEAARRKEANAGDRHLLLRWLMQNGDEQAVRRFIESARDSEHISIPAVGQFLLDSDLQLVATASDALPALALADLENVRAKAATDVELMVALTSGQQSALQNLASNEDLRGRLATDLQQADVAFEGPLWRGVDTSGWYAAIVAAALSGSARSGYVLRPDASGLADVLGTWPVPAGGQLSRWLKVQIAEDRGSTDEALEALATAKMPGVRAVADLLDGIAKQSDAPDPKMIEAVRVASPHFDSRPASRLIWAEVLRVHERDLDRSGRLVASLVDQAPGAFPSEEVALAKQRGQVDRLEQIALDDKLPFPARLEAAAALADRGVKAPADRALRRLARERPFDAATHERLIRFLHDAGRPGDALAVALDLVRRHGEDDSFRAARARCTAARQLDAMGRHEDALTMVERALPTEAVCAYRIATVQLAHLGRKQDAEGLLLAHLARHPQVETVATVAEVRWRTKDDANAADVLAHSPVPLTRRDFQKIGERFADVFRSRPPADVKHAIEALLQAEVQPQWIVELGSPLTRAGAAAQAFELYSLLGEKVPAEKRAGLRFSAWSALRAAKGASAAEPWLRKQLEPEESADDQLATAAFGEGLDEGLWELFPYKPLDPAMADRLALLRAASLVRRGERGPRRDALAKEISDPLARWKAELARRLGLAGAYASWDLRLARFLLGEGREEDFGDEAAEGSRPCEAPYYFALRAAAETRARDAAGWYRVALECRNPRQPEFAWAYRGSAQPSRFEPERSPPAKPLQASR